MKKLLSLLIIFTISISSFAAPLPWNKAIKVKPLTQVTYAEVWWEPNLKRIDLTAKRAFAYNTCEYCTFQVKVWKQVRIPSFPSRIPQTIWMWVWNSCIITFPAGSDTGYFSFFVNDGEYPDTQDFMVSDLVYCY